MPNPRVKKAEGAALGTDGMAEADVSSCSQSSSPSRESVPPRSTDKREVAVVSIDGLPAVWRRIRRVGEAMSGDGTETISELERPVEGRPEGR